MNPDLELALRKQRLLLRSAALRGEFANHGAALAPLLAVGDHVRDGALWLRRHPEVFAVAGAALLVLRPRALLRWGRRGIGVWRTWRHARAWLREHVHHSA